MKSLLKRLWEEENGQDLVEYALLAGFIATPIWYVWLGVSLWRGARS